MMGLLVTGFNRVCSGGGFFLEETAYVEGAVYISYREKEHGTDEQNGEGVDEGGYDFSGYFSTCDAFVEREDDVSTVKHG